MTDLNTKFTDLEDMINSNHLGITDALSAILSALGGAPTDTFSALIAAVEETNTLLTAIHTDNNEKLDLIFDTLDVINNNASLNAQRMYLLALQNACPCDDSLPLLPPDLDTDPTALETTEKCQRIQYFIDLFRSWVLTTGAYLADHGSVSSFQINNLLQLVLTERGITTGQLTTMPTSTRDNISTLLTTVGTPSLVNGALNDAINTSTLLADMRQALYGTDNATDGKDAVDTAIGASGVDYPGLIVAMFYGSWANDIYSAVPIVDASAYDGSICIPEAEWPLTAGCISFDSVETHLSNGQTLQCIVWPDGGFISPASVSGAPDDLTADQAIFGHTDLINLWVSSSPTCHCYYNANGTPNFDVDATPARFTTSGDYYTMLTASTPFTITLCVDEP